MKSVFVLFHTHQRPDNLEDSKPLGNYASEPEAEAALARASTKPGFSDQPGGFEISQYVVGKDQWTEGFMTISAD